MKQITYEEWFELLADFDRLRTAFILLCTILILGIFSLIVAIIYDAFSKKK